MTTSQKNETLLKLGYDCKGMLTFPGTTRFKELSEKNQRLAEIVYEEPSKTSINDFIDITYDLVTKYTNDKPLKIVNAHDLPSMIEAHLPATKPRRQRDSLNMVDRF